MSDPSTTERLAEAAGRSAGMSIDHLTFLLGAGAIVTAISIGSCSTNARIEALGETLRTEVHDVRTEIRDVRTEVRDVRTEIRDVLRTPVSTAASFEDVAGQLSTLAVCIVEIRNLVDDYRLLRRGLRRADVPARPNLGTTCDDAVKAILARYPPPAGQ